MRATYKSLSIPGVFLFLALFGTSICFSGQLIEPTRTLEGGEKATGRVTVFSEPPELDVSPSLTFTPAHLHICPFAPLAMLKKTKRQSKKTSTAPHALNN